MLLIAANCTKSVSIAAAVRLPLVPVAWLALRPDVPVAPELPVEVVEPPDVDPEPDAPPDAVLPLPPPDCVAGVRGLLPP
jgi:hypothetical protein